MAQTWNEALRVALERQHHEWLARHAAEKRTREHQMGEVTLSVGLHGWGCDGEVLYISKFLDVRVRPTPALPGSRHYPWLEEHVECYCTKCRLPIIDSRRLARYAEYMTSYRNRRR